MTSFVSHKNISITLSSSVQNIVYGNYAISFFIYGIINNVLKKKSDSIIFLALEDMNNINPKQQHVTLAMKQTTKNNINRYLERKTQKHGAQKKTLTPFTYGETTKFKFGHRLSCWIHA